MFPISNEAGKVIAFGGRAMGDDMPKYMNSPETPIYSKSDVLYHLDRAKEALRQSDFAVLVEGYMDAIAVARAGICERGGQLRHQPGRAANQTARRASRGAIVVNYDPDTAGQAATERSLALLLEKEFDVRVLALPGGADPDKFLKEQGAEAYKKLLAQAPPYLDYLIGRARQMDRTTAAGKVAALNFLMPYVQRLPNRLLRSEWATRIASELRVDEPVLREALRRAADERRSEVKPKAELLTPAVKPAERQLIRMLFEAEEFREKLAHEIASGDLHRGLETRNIFEALVVAIAAGEKPDAAAVAATLDDKDRRLFFEILFETLPEGTWEDAESCLGFLRHRPVAQELDGSAERRLKRILRRKRLRSIGGSPDGTAAAAVPRARAGRGQNPS